MMDDGYCCVQMLDEVTPLHSAEFRERLLKLGNPYKTLQRMHELIKDICKELNERIAASAEPEQCVTEVTTLAPAVDVTREEEEDSEDIDSGAEDYKEKKAAKKVCMHAMALCVDE